MNFVGHIAAGLRTSRDRAPMAFMVGTALPDFASMARVRLGRGEGPLGAGIALHHATDHAFHTQDWFVAAARELRDLLRRDGLPDGAARACAHVGPELLLDGELLEDGAVARAVDHVYQVLAQPPADVVDIVDKDERGRWRAHLVGVTTRLDPFTYRDPDVVACRLHTIMSRRPRLAFDDGLVDVVAVRMRAVQPYVREMAPQVLATVSAAARRSRHR